MLIFHKLYKKTLHIKNKEFFTLNFGVQAMFSLRKYPFKREKLKKKKELLTSHSNTGSFLFFFFHGQNFHNQCFPKNVSCWLWYSHVRGETVIILIIESRFSTNLHWAQWSQYTWGHTMGTWSVTLHHTFWKANNCLIKVIGHLDRFILIAFSKP